MKDTKTHFKLLILGAGSGGTSLAARLKKSLGAENIALIEPSETHYYQPLWTLVGAGLVKKETTARRMQDVIPVGIKWFKDSVIKVDPIAKKVVCGSSAQLTYDYLIVATGLKLDFQKIKGIEGNLGKNGLCSIYQYKDAETTAEMIQNFKGGEAIFVMPPVPIKCAGAPQKIMYLADDIFRKNGARQHTKITFTVAGKVIFGVPLFAKSLNEVAKRKQIEVKYSHKLLEVIADKKLAIFEKSSELNVEGKIETKTESITLSYDLLHVVPPMSAHDYVRESGLAFTAGPQTGWLKVDQTTLQHSDFANIFGIGDVTGVPNSKTGAAIRKQAPVVAQNILAVMAGRPPTAKYDGYSSCPLITGIGKVILAEFGYDGKLLPSFPMDMSKERRSMWILKKNLLPRMYWQGMMKGRM